MKQDTNYNLIVEWIEFSQRLRAKGKRQTKLDYVLFFLTDDDDDDDDDEDNENNYNEEDDYNDQWW